MARGWGRHDGITVPVADARDKRAGQACRVCLLKRYRSTSPAVRVQSVTGCWKHREVQGGIPYPYAV